MATKKRKGLWLLAIGVVAVAAAVTFQTATADTATGGSGKQADGPGIITVEQLNMCMWGSKETKDCFPNANDPSDPAWADAERHTAELKRDSMVTQYQRHTPDVITVNEGCLNDLRTVADKLGYQLRYQETGGGADGKPRECTVDRGAGVNAILAKKFSGDGPQGYFESKGHRSYICAQVSTSEWSSVRVCTAHLSLAQQGDHQKTECGILRDQILGKSTGYVVFAGDLNMKGANQNCAPSSFHGLHDLARPGTPSIPQDGLQHIYYSANGFWRHSPVRQRVAPTVCRPGPHRLPRVQSEVSQPFR
jgi:hypothetical protein